MLDFQFCHRRCGTFQINHFCSENKIKKKKQIGCSVVLDARLQIELKLKSNADFSLFEVRGERFEWSGVNAFTIVMSRTARSVLEPGRANRSVSELLF